MILEVRRRATGWRRLDRRIARDGVRYLPGER